MGATSPNDKRRIVGIVLLSLGAIAFVLMLMPAGDGTGTNWWAGVGRSNVLTCVAVVLVGIGARLLMIARRPRHAEPPEEAADEQEQDVSDQP